MYTFIVDVIEVYMAWLVIIILTLIIEMVNMGIFCVFITIGALVAYVASIFEANLLIQIGLFIAVSILLLLFVRPYAVHLFAQEQANSRRQRLVGMDAIVLTDINYLKDTGMVSVDNRQWAAEAREHEKIFRVGEVVRIVKVTEDKVIVKGK